MVVHLCDEGQPPDHLMFYEEDRWWNWTQYREHHGWEYEKPKDEQRILALRSEVDGALRNRGFDFFVDTVAVKAGGYFAFAESWERSKVWVGIRENEHAVPHIQVGVDEGEEGAIYETLHLHEALWLTDVLLTIRRLPKDERIPSVVREELSALLDSLP